MSYPGICNKYGAGTTMIASYAVPAVTATLANLALYQSFDSAKLALSSGNMAGIIGFGFGMVAHSVSNIVLRYNKVGMTRGAEITRRVQFVAYAIPTVLLTTTAAAFDYKSLETTTPHEFPTEDTTSTPDGLQNDATINPRIAPPRPKMP